MARARYIIYCHTSPSGKQYIGQTKKTMEKRWRAHVRDASYKKTTAHTSPIFHAAIRKYGPDAFTHEILDVVFSQEGANIAECVWIEKRGTVSPGGYNLDRGGRTHSVHESSRQKMSKSMRAVRAAHTAEEKAALSAKIREALALLPPEERSDIVRRGRATLGPEKRAWVLEQMRAARIAKAAARRAQKPEKKIDATLSEKRRADWAATPPEKRRERGRKIWEARRRNAALSPEERNKPKPRVIVTPERDVAEGGALDHCARRCGRPRSLALEDVRQLEADGGGAEAKARQEDEQALNLGPHPDSGSLTTK
ncbi:MAG: GIY-YIG nuclease family protein [Candidatus Dormibacteria bacterium]